MTPGPAEEVGKVATGFIDAMKGQPLALALVLMNILLLVLFWFTIKTVGDHNQERELALMNEQKEVRALLAKCVVPPQGGSMPNLTPTFIKALEKRRQVIQEMVR